MNICVQLLCCLYACAHCECCPIVTGGADVQQESSVSNGARSNGSSRKAASTSSPTGDQAPSSPAGENVAASRDFLEFQPPAGSQISSTAGAGSSPDSAPPPSDAAAAAPAASAAVAAPQQSASLQQQQQSPVQASDSASQGADAAPQQRAANGVQQAEQLLDIVFVSSEAGACADPNRRRRLPQQHTSSHDPQLSM